MANAAVPIRSIDKQQQWFKLNEFSRRMRMKRRLGNTVVVVGLTFVLLVFVGTSIAQDKPADNLQIFLEKIKADKKLLVAVNMQLTDAEAKAFWPVYEEYQSELFLLRARTVKLISDYGATYDTMTNTIAKKLLDELLALQALRPKVGSQYVPKFRKALPDAKVVRYYQIENKIDAAINWELATGIPLIKIDNHE
jgi:hypothetical protein